MFGCEIVEQNNCVCVVSLLSRGTSAVIIIISYKTIMLIRSNHKGKDCISLIRGQYGLLPKEGAVINFFFLINM